MNTTSIITVVAILVLFGIVLGIGSFVRRRNNKNFQAQYGEEYNLSVKKMGSEKKAQAELRGREKHMQTMDIRSLTDAEQEQYHTEWAAVQSDFVNEPGKAIGAADHLIMEVMQLRNYPVSDFNQRAADVSIRYPELVKEYRAAREIAIKNTDQKATTEEMRQAMISYRSLFERLVGTSTVG
ncbi:MAG: hypothetical protein CVU42_07335 [Chloroflexi bacterium HGW-Chloroflexi-4]|jgi:hypothetical protein|nr:MAG: hypothetical protein CVU42_07335 [Chloroflexi bacterium HGW-Chloroflexi-4]